MKFTTELHKEAKMLFDSTRNQNRAYDVTEDLTYSDCLGYVTKMERECFIMSHVEGDKYSITNYLKTSETIVFYSTKTLKKLRLFDHPLKGICNFVLLFKTHFTLEYLIDLNCRKLQDKDTLKNSVNEQCYNVEKTTNENIYFVGSTSKTKVFIDKTIISKLIFNKKGKAIINKDESKYLTTEYQYNIACENIDAFSEYFYDIFSNKQYTDIKFNKKMINKIHDANKDYLVDILNAYKRRKTRQPKVENVLEILECRKAWFSTLIS